MRCLIFWTFAIIASGKEDPIAKAMSAIDALSKGDHPTDSAFDSLLAEQAKVKDAPVETAAVSPEKAAQLEAAMAKEAEEEAAAPASEEAEEDTEEEAAPVEEEPGSAKLLAQDPADVGDALGDDAAAPAAAARPNYAGEYATYVSATTRTADTNSAEVAAAEGQASLQNIDTWRTEEQANALDLVWKLVGVSASMVVKAQACLNPGGGMCGIATGSINDYIGAAKGNYTDAVNRLDLAQRLMAKTLESIYNGRTASQEMEGIVPGAATR